MVLNQLDIQAQDKESDPDLTLLTKVISKWIIDLNVQHKFVKLLEDNIGENFDEFDTVVTFWYEIKSTI